MATIQGIEDEVKAAAARGGSLSSIIPGVVRRAHEWLELNYTFHYMKRFVSFTLSKGYSSAPLPSRVKEFYWIRTAPSRSKDAEDLKYLVRISPEEIDSIERGTPGGFWVDGLDFIRFDKETDKDKSLEMYHSQFTDWNNVSSTWLTENAEELVLAQSMIGLAPYMREANLVELWKPQRDAALQAVLRQQEEYEYGGRNMKASYTPKFTN